MKSATPSRSFVTLLPLPMPNIYFAADHAGFVLKNALIEYVRTLGYGVEDMGAFSQDPGDDYPDFIMPLAKRVADEIGARGVIIGGSGQGEAMCANRVPGIRAAVYYGENPEIVSLSREHGNSNILSLGARFISEEDAKAAVKLFLETPFSGDERHVRRLAKF